jgi:phosphoribosylformylglycinamidine synthase
MDAENLLGAMVDIPVKTREDFSFFSESQSRVILSVSKEKKDAFESLVKTSKVPYLLLGKTGGKSLKVNNKYEFELKHIANLYYNSISKLMNVTV